MEFKQLQSFVSVVKYKSFSKAAEKLYLSQPTVSTHIRQLEEELHTHLILRTTKSIEITPKGLEIYEYAAHILELKERIIQKCTLSDTKKIIHLGASTIPSAYILPEILPEFGRTHPDVYFAIHQSDSRGIEEGLLNGIYDLGLIGMHSTSEELTCLPFCKDRMIIITPVTEYFLDLKTNGTFTMDEFFKHPVILREKGSGSKKSFDLFLENSGIQERDLHITARINDQEAIKNLVAENLGVSIISERAATNFLNEKRLLAFELPGPTPPRNLYLAYRSDDLPQKHIKDFTQFIKKKYDQKR